VVANTLLVHRLILWLVDPRAARSASCARARAARDLAAAAKFFDEDRMTARPWPLTTALLAGAVLLTACGGGVASPSAPSGSGGAAAPEMTAITVGVLPIVDVAPVYLAIEEGLFEAEGLTVTPEVTQGGAAAIPALQGGDLDIAYGAWPSFLIANQAGIELRAVSDGVAAAPGFTQFLALPDSGLGGDPSRLAGTTVALNTLGNLGELALRETLADAGLEFTDVTAVEIPFPDMGAALDGGNVNVIWASEPGVSGNKAELGAVTVIDSYVDDMEGFPVAGYFVTGDFARQNPNTVAAFARAVQAAASMLSDDPELPARVAATYTELPADVLAGVSFPEYRGTLEAALLERVYRKMLEHGMIQEGLDIGSLVGG
jgi:NitT/TauT family transport system substrate-binding protein